ncbi:MAG: hypothetical protein AAGH41_02050 [Pseudomonadota bacterium]
MQAPLTFAVDNRLPEILERVQQLFPRKQGDRRLPPMEQLLFGVVAHGLAASSAMASYRRLRKAFPRLTDLRDSHPGALQREMIGLPAAALKAAAIPDILKAVDAAFGSLSLDGLDRWEPDQAVRFLTRLPRVTEDIALSVLAFAGAERTSLTVDQDVARPLRRLQLVEPGAPLSALPRQLIERSPLDWRSSDFAHLSQGLSRVADRFCHQGKPECHACPLASLCPSAQSIEAKSAEVVAFPFGKRWAEQRASA